MGCESSKTQEMGLLNIEADNICSLSDIRQLPYDMFHVHIQKVKHLCQENQLVKATKIGDKLFSKHHILEAIEVYQSIIEKDPKFGLENFDGLGNSEMAISYYLQNVWQHYDKQKQEKKSVLDSLSLCYMILAVSPKEHMNALSKGTEWYRNMVQKQQTNIGLLIGYGNILYNQEKVDEALQNYDKATEVYENFVNTYVLKAVVYQFSKSQKQKSIDLAQKILLLSKNNEFGQLIILLNIENLDERIQKLEKLSAKYPNYLRILNQMGADYMEFKEDYKKSKECFQRTVKINPLYYKGYTNIGSCYRYLQDYQNALNYSFKALQINKLFLQSYSVLRLTFGKLNSTDEDIDKELQKYPNVKKEQFWMKYGQNIENYHSQGVDKAIPYYKRSIESNQSFSLTHQLLAQAYVKKGMKNQAIQSYKKCIQLDPGYYYAYFRLGMLQMEQGYVQEAIKLYQKSIQLNPRHAYSYHNLGKIYFDRKNYQKAEQYYINALEYDSKNSLVYTSLGICYMAQKKYKEAFNAFTEAKNNFESTKKNWGNDKMQFVQDTLKNVDIDSDKWKIYLKSGSITDDQRIKLHGLMGQFSNKLKIHEKINPDIKMPLQRVMHPSVLEITKIIYENKFRLVGLKEVFQHVMTLYCDVDEDYFHIVPLYIVQYFLLCVYELKIWVEDAEKVSLQMMKQLAGMVANKQKEVNESQKDEDKTQNNSEKRIIKIELTQCQPLNKNINLFKDAAYFTSYEDLYAQIDKVNNAAKPSFNDFNLLVQEVRTKGKGIPGGISMKIPSKSEDQFKVIMRIMQKMFKKQINEERINKIIRNIQAKIVHADYGNMNEIVSQIVDSWNNQITKILKERRQNNIETPCFISDLIRAKCTFNTIEDLINAVKVTDSYCKSKGYDIVEVDNRLNKIQTKDVVLKIRIRDAVCEFQLAMPQSAKLFHLDHCVYEIIRSPLGCIFGSYLFISKSVKYPLVKNCQDMFQELSKSKDMMDKINRMYPQYVMNALTKDWKMNKG